MSFEQPDVIKKEPPVEPEQIFGLVDDDPAETASLTDNQPAERAKDYEKLILITDQATYDKAHPPLNQDQPPPTERTSSEKPETVYEYDAGTKQETEPSSNAKKLEGIKSIQNKIEAARQIIADAREAYGGKAPSRPERKPKEGPGDLKKVQENIEEARRNIGEMKDIINKK